MGRVRHGGGEHWVEYSPGDEMHTEIGDQLVWEEVLQHVERWLRALWREIEGPDLWSLEEEERETLEQAIASPEASALFAPAEVSQLEHRVDNIAAEVIELRQLRGDDLATIQAEVAEIKADLRKLNRKQWIRSAIGWIVTLTARFAIPSAVATELMRHVVSGLQLWLKS